MMMPVDVSLDVIDVSTDERMPLIDIQLTDDGEILTAFVGGVRVRGQVDAHEFIKVMLGYRWLSEKAKSARAPKAAGQ